MKKILVVCALFSLCCIPAFAQDAPKFEVFGGYSLAHLFQNDDLYDEWGLESMTHHGFIVAAEE